MQAIPPTGMTPGESCWVVYATVHHKHEKYGPHHPGNQTLLERIIVTDLHKSQKFMTCVSKILVMLLTNGDKQYPVWSRPKKAFSNRLNCPRVSHCRNLEDKFHRRGPAVVKHRSLKVLCGRWTTHVAVLVEWSRHVLMSEMSWQLTARFIGALSDRLWKTRTTILNWTPCHTDNQCSCSGIGLMWSWHHSGQPRFATNHASDTPWSLSLIHIWRCRRSTLCRSRWSPYH